MWRGDESLEVERPSIAPVEAGEKTEHGGDAEVQRRSVDRLNYAGSAIGAMKVSEVTASMNCRSRDSGGASGRDTGRHTPAATWPGERRNAGCANAKMISAAEMIEAASMRAAVALRPAPANSAGTEFAVAVVWDAATIAMRGGAIRPFSVIWAKIASTTTTTKERDCRAEPTSAREPQPSTHHAVDEQQSA